MTSGIRGVAARILALLITVGLVSGCGSRQPEVATFPAAESLVLDGVTVVDTGDGHLTPGMSILMDKGRIVRIAPGGTLGAEAGIRRIDARGKFVVPGYNDMHAHVLGVEHPSAALALMLTNGVTGFRQMHGSPELLEQRRNHTLPIPRESPAVLAMPGSLLTPANAGTPEMAVDTVREQKAQGAAFIKVGMASAPVFLAALEESNRVHIPFVGH